MTDMKISISSRQRGLFNSMTIWISSQQDMLNIIEDMVMSTRFRWSISSMADMADMIMRIMRINICRSLTNTIADMNKWTSRRGILSSTMIDITKRTSCNQGTTHVMIDMNKWTMMTTDQRGTNIKQCYGRIIIDGITVMDVIESTH